jgi:hypothetical protein
VRIFGAWNAPKMRTIFVFVQGAALRVSHNTLGKVGILYCRGPLHLPGKKYSSRELCVKIA